MELPSGVFRQQQRWNPDNIITDGPGRLVAYNSMYSNCEHSYNNNLGFNPPPPSTSSFNYQFNDRQENYGKKLIATNSPSSQNIKKNSKLIRCSSQLSNLVSLKSRIGVEYRRYAVPRESILKFDEFFKKIESIHQLQGTSFAIYYSDQDGEMLPINNDDNLAKAINTTTRLKSTHYIVESNNNNFPDYNQQYQFQYSPHQQKLQQVILERPLLKLFLEKKGIPNELYYLPNFNSKCKRKDNLINMLMPSNSSSDSRPRISMPEDFRQVSSIIDADILPPERRRVVLKRGGSDKPLGFYIRDGTYLKPNAQGIIEKNYGIFISRLVPGGLAESTNLLAENDEILEVNGIEVGKNKRLDQVRDMMIANSSNLIITTCPAKRFNQYSANYRLRNPRNMNNFIGRDRLPSTQSNSSDLGEDFVRHHMN